MLGEWGFRRLTLSVDRRVLVPRPETEVVVERCLARLSGIAEPRVLDVGTGSGAIALALADEHPGALVTGIDASPDALEVAGANALRAGARGRRFASGTCSTGSRRARGTSSSRTRRTSFREEIDVLEPEVREWEPREALIGVGATEAVARGALAVLERRRRARARGRGG